MNRVQIPAYTDRWMMGDRYGVVVKVTKANVSQKQKVANQTRAALLTKARFSPVEIAHVKLDKSGKTVRVILDDCTPVN